MEPTGDRRRFAEEEFFRRKEQELLAKLKTKAEEEAHKKGLAEAIGLTDEDLLEVLREMGFDRSTVALLFLVPILEVAWSDGSMTEQERDAILEGAHAHGVTAGTPAHDRLLEWLKEKPDPILFHRALDVIHDLLASQSGADPTMSGSRLLDACQNIAAASGGFFGIGGKVSKQEREVLQRITSQVEKAHAAAALRVTEDLARK